MPPIMVDRSNIQYPPRVLRGNPGAPSNQPAPDPAPTPAPTPPVQPPAVNPGDWIDQALKNAGSTDDPAYWHNVIAQHNDTTNESAKQYWIDRINRGNGSQFVRSGQLQPVFDPAIAGSQMGGNLGSLLQMLFGGNFNQNQGAQPYNPHHGQGQYQNPNNPYGPYSQYNPYQNNQTNTPQGNQQYAQNQFSNQYQQNPGYNYTNPYANQNINFQGNQGQFRSAAPSGSPFQNKQQPMGSPSFYNQPNFYNGNTYGQRNNNQMFGTNSNFQY